MKKTLLLVATLFCFSGLVFADICTDIRQSYQDRMLALKRDTDAALSQTTDPMEISAIRASYEIQLQQMTMEMDNTLTSAGCNVVTPPPTDPPTDPGTPPTDPPTDPGTPPTDPPTDPGTPPTDPPTGACREQMAIFAQQLKGLDLPRHEFVARLKAHGREIGCNFGSWQRCEHGNSGHHNCKPKPNCDPKPPQCDKPKPPKEDCDRKRQKKHCGDHRQHKDRKCGR